PTMRAENEILLSEQTLGIPAHARILGPAKEFAAGHVLEALRLQWQLPVRSGGSGLNCVDRLGRIKKFHECVGSEWLCAEFSIHESGDAQRVVVLECIGQKGLGKVLIADRTCEAEDGCGSHRSVACIGGGG